MDSKQLKSKTLRVNALSKMIIENSSLYRLAVEESKYPPIAGTNFPKNANYSKTAIKSQIVSLRNELLLLSELL